jgi:hypothetical protein
MQKSLAQDEPMGWSCRFDYASFFLMCRCLYWSEKYRSGILNFCQNSLELFPATKGSRAVGEG